MLKYRQGAEVGYYLNYHKKRIVVRGILRSFSMHTKRGQMVRNKKSDGEVFERDIFPVITVWFK